MTAKSLARALMLGATIYDKQHDETSSRDELACVTINALAEAQCAGAQNMTTDERAFVAELIEELGAYASYNTDDERERVATRAETIARRVADELEAFRASV